MSEHWQDENINRHMADMLRTVAFFDTIEIEDANPYCTWTPDCCPPTDPLVSQHGPVKVFTKEEIDALNNTKRGS